MECEICKKNINVGSTHPEDIELLIKDGVCWLCKVRGKAENDH